jgi:hypothetical protein
MVGLCIAAMILAGLVVGTALPWRVGLALRARGDAKGAWALAGGAELFACAATVAGARGSPLIVDVRAFGRSLLRRLFPPAKPRPAPKKPAKPTKPRPLHERYARFARWIDPFDLLVFLTAERRRLSIRDLDASVRLGLADVALAGEIAGVLAVLSALGSPFGRLRHEIDWSGREHVECSLSLSLRFSPALLAWDTARFLVSSLRFKRRARAELVPTPSRRT